MGLSSFCLFYREVEWEKLTKDILRLKQTGYFLMCGVSDQQFAIELELAEFYRADAHSEMEMACED